jgi:hypothetical protein
MQENDEEEEGKLIFTFPSFSISLTLTNENCVFEEIQSRLNSGNPCYHSVQNLLSSHLISKNLKMRIYETTILPVVLYGCETWSFTLKKKTEVV